MEPLDMHSFVCVLRIKMSKFVSLVYQTGAGEQSRGVYGECI